MCSPDAPGDRDETPDERDDRRWNELVQELRVTQTGVQVLAGFLLTLPFQQRFNQISSLDRAAYLTAVVASIISIALLISPVSAHRLLLSTGRKGPLVAVGNVVAVVALAALGVTMAAVTFLIVNVVVGGGVAMAALVATVVLFVGLWLVMPMIMRVTTRDRS